MRLSKEVIDKAKEALRSIKGLDFASLFGSFIVKGETRHDIDVAVKASDDDKYTALCAAIQKLSETLNIEEEKIDLVDLDRASLELKKEVVMNGIILLDKAGYKRRLIEELNAKYAEYNELQRITVKEWMESSDPSSVNVNIVKSRIDFAKAEANFLRENVLSRGVTEAVGSPVLQRLMERSYHLILEAILDVCRHITSIMGWGPALSYSDYVEACFKHKVISEELRDKIVTGVRLRNVIIHRYLEVDYRKLYEEASKLEEVVKVFERQILTFIRGLR